MNATLKADLKKLEPQAFYRSRWGADLLRKFHRLPKKARLHPEYPLLEKLRDWLLAPISLWPANLQEIGYKAWQKIHAGKRLDPAMIFLLEMLEEAPSEAAQAAVIQHENDVQHGNYEHLIHASHKFDHKERELAYCAKLMEEWRTIKRAFEVRLYQDHKKLMRQALKEGLKGSRRDYWVMEQLGLDPRTDPSTLRRLLREHKTSTRGASGK